MTSSKLFVAFGNIDDDYLLTTLKSIQLQKRTIPRLRLRYAIIAATLALLVALIPIAVILASRTPAPPPPVTTPLPDPPTPSTHLSITDIPGAFKVDTGLMDYQNAQNSPKWIFSHFLEIIHKDYFAFLGTATSCESVLIPDQENNRYLHLSIIEVEVNEHVTNANGLQTVKMGYACWYYPNETGYRLDHNNVVMDLGIKTQNEPYGFYIIDEAEHRSFKFSNKNLELSDYADYYVILHCSYDGKNVSYPNWFNEDIEKFRSGIED